MRMNHYAQRCVCHTHITLSRNPSDPLENTANSQILSQPAWILGLNLLAYYRVSKICMQIQYPYTHNCHTYSSQWLECTTWFDVCIHTIATLTN